jgi:choline dehydrogenase-like flavoprotein
VRIRLPEGGYKTINPHPHYHHMGTTRMDEDPKRGVVDANCRLHELPNLFVAGSSVFPTVGNVNPTLTIIALAFRLADHLKGLRS